jgi:hypothetical protein
MTLREVSKNRAVSPPDEAVFKVLSLGLAQHQQAVGDADRELERGVASVFDPFDGRVPMGGVGSN